MAATLASVAMINAKCLNINSPKSLNFSKPAAAKPISILSMQSLPKGLTASSKPSDDNKSNLLSSPLTSTALAAAIFSAVSSCNPAFAAQQIAEIAEGDNRALALLLPLLPAIAWVLYNILQPALNQINKMRSSKGIIIGLGLGGLAASEGFLSTSHASAAASEIAALADATSSDNRGTLLLFVVTPAIFWVLYNILQPALNQINRMRSQ